MVTSFPMLFDTLFSSIKPTGTTKKIAYLPENYYFSLSLVNNLTKFACFDYNLGFIRCGINENITYVHL